MPGTLVRHALWVCGRCHVSNSSFGFGRDTNRAAQTSPHMGSPGCNSSVHAIVLQTIAITLPRSRIAASKLHFTHPIGGRHHNWISHFRELPSFHALQWLTKESFTSLAMFKGSACLFWNLALLRAIHKWSHIRTANKENSWTWVSSIFKVDKRCIKHLINWVGVITFRVLILNGQQEFAQDWTAFGQ